MSAEAEFWSFPTNPDEFGQDDRISYSKLDKKYIAVQPDGTEYEFDEDLKRWVPIIDESLIQEQQKGYFMEANGADDGNSQAAPRARGSKRKKDGSDDREVSCVRTGMLIPHQSTMSTMHPPIITTIDRKKLLSGYTVSPVVAAMAGNEVLLGGAGQLTSRACLGTACRTTHTTTPVRQNKQRGSRGATTTGRPSRTRQST
jgi:hypothetical protein